MRKQILIIAMIFSVLMVGSVLATSTQVKGNTYLEWKNAYERPQLFEGQVTGGLEGTISLTTNTDYDESSTNVGTTWSDNMILVLSDSSCSGFYAGSNVNAGRNAGTFTLYCDNGNIIQGMMHGVNDNLGNINLEYVGLIISPTPGPKGDRGDTGSQGEQGLQGPSGEKGDKGDSGIQGLPGTNGVDGIQGPKGDTGDQGIQGLPGKDGIDGTNGATGPQGIQGLKGDKGDTGVVGPQGIAGTNASVDLTPLLNRISALETFKSKVLQYFVDFNNWLNPPPFVCNAGDKKCVGNYTSVCSNNAWVQNTSICAIGCINGVCNQPPQPTKQDCTLKFGKYYPICIGSGTSNAYFDGWCRPGQGTSQSCNIGQCNYRAGNTVNCVRGCNSVTGTCN